MPATPGKLLKIPFSRCVSTPASPLPDSGNSGFDPTFSFVEGFCFQRGTATVVGTGLGSTQARLQRGTPIVGNLAASSELLGLIDCELGEFTTIPRAVRKYTTTNSKHTIWESNKYFGAPGKLIKPPKVVLIRRHIGLFQNAGGIDPLSFEDYLDKYAAYFDAKGLLVIVDHSASAYYNSYNYGIPLETYTMPYGTPAFEDYIGGDLLVVNLHAFDMELVIADIGNLHSAPTTVAYIVMLNSYWREFAQDQSGGFPPAYPSGIGAYTQFTSPLISVAAWQVTSSKYNRRRCVNHFQQFTQSPIPFATVRVNDGPGGATSSFTYGSPGHMQGTGKDYFLANCPPDWVVGRDYYTGPTGPWTLGQTTPAVVSERDAAQATMESIFDFYGE